VIKRLCGRGGVFDAPASEQETLPPTLGRVTRLYDGLTAMRRLRGVEDSAPATAEVWPRDRSRTVTLTRSHAPRRLYGSRRERVSGGARNRLVAIGRQPSRSRLCGGGGVFDAPEPDKAALPRRCPRVRRQSGLGEFERETSPQALRRGTRHNDGLPAMHHLRGVDDSAPATRAPSTRERSGIVTLTRSHAARGNEREDAPSSEVHVRISLCAWSLSKCRVSHITPSASRQPQP
jgi:hypothetical protein